MIEEKYNEWKISFGEINLPDLRLISVKFTIAESEKVLFRDLPSSNREIVIVGEEGYLQFSGNIIKLNGQAVININYNFRYGGWDLPLSPMYHVDLLRRLIETRQINGEKVSDIKISQGKEGVWLSYKLTPLISNQTTLFELFGIGKEIDDWGRSKVLELQNQIGRSHLEMADNYSILSWMDIDELVQKLESEIDSNLKGKLLEGLIAGLFSKVDGFEVNERVRTKTEEIDLLVLNKSKNPLWSKEPAIILVECKNWTSKCGKNELVLFKEKLSNRYGRAKIGFFISWNGFTDTFHKESLRSSKEKIIVIPITGEEIKSNISKANFENALERWFVNAVKK